MDNEQLLKTIQEKIKAAAEPERIAFMKKSAGDTALTIIGVKVPNLNTLVKDLAKDFKDTPPEQVINLALALAESGILENQMVACKLISAHKKAKATLTAETVKKLGKVMNLDNWISVDNFAVLVAGYAWQQRRIPDEEIRTWARSDNRWRRRTAIVSTVTLNQKAHGGTGDVPRTLDIGRIVAADKDDMVAKGLSWALRELSKRDTQPVIQFLEQHESELPARVKREVWRKIKTGKK